MGLLTKSLGREVPVVAFPGLSQGRSLRRRVVCGFWSQQQTPVLDHEEEQHPVDKPQQVTMVGLGRERTDAESLTQRAVVPMGQEP